MRASDCQQLLNIVRDTWGIPHAWGKTDADVAFALGYAHCEDDFGNMQMSLLASRGVLATAIGEDGVGAV